MLNKKVNNNKENNKVTNTNQNNTQYHLQQLRELFQRNLVESEHERRMRERIEEEKKRREKENEEVKTEEVKSEKIQNNITELVFVLDRSGSMSGLESDTIGGFNAMIEKQKKQEGECYVSTVLFDHVCEVLHDRIRLQDVPRMTTDHYTVRGCTALIDAIGGAIHHIENIHKYARREDVPEHTLFVITTDGMENASHKYTTMQVKRMIEHHKEKDDWEFIFIGANIDAVETATDFGISYDRAVNYKADAKGTRVLYDTVAEAACNVRANKRLHGEWSKAINDDYNNPERKR